MSKIKFWRSRREKRWQDGGLGLEYMHAPTEKEVVAMHGHVALLADGRQVSIFGFDPSRGAVGQVFVHFLTGSLSERWVDLNELRIPRMPAVGSRWVRETGRVVTVVEDAAAREAWHVVAESGVSIVNWPVEDWYAKNKPKPFEFQVDTAYMVPPSDAASWPSAIGTIREAFGDECAARGVSPQPTAVPVAPDGLSAFAAKDVTPAPNVLTFTYQPGEEALYDRVPRADSRSIVVVSDDYRWARTSAATGASSKQVVELARMAWKARHGEPGRGLRMHIAEDGTINLRPDYDKAVSHLMFTSDTPPKEQTAPFVEYRVRHPHPLASAEQVAVHETAVNHTLNDVPVPGFYRDTVFPDHSPQPQTLAEATLARSRFDAWPGLDPKDRIAYDERIAKLAEYTVTAEDVMRADDEYVRHIAGRPVVLPPAANSRHLRTSNNTSWRVIDTTAETVTAVCGSSYETFTLDEFTRGFWSIVERDTKPAKTDGPVALAIREEAKRPPEGVSAEQWLRELLRVVEYPSYYAGPRAEPAKVVRLVRQYADGRRTGNPVPRVVYADRSESAIGPTPKYGRTLPPSAEERERWRADDEARAMRVRQETVARIRAERSGR